ncbi:S-isoprenylcysteine methyltransferase [Cereibacter changlensis JA139]|uniref:S-isoprenylcysteine methyltransferase n=2 Tax=Cereibacter changlensis TaxID=402884 RepID=A0A2T4JU60_9RHOB|nr:methyltransferase [Cereibacter changlensis]PTE21435.1 S-isoprenylcysteine methyltransferase [Cereibacter changlensis JA139]PZX57331.1 protein-S-isoprenylcysteine O-methyltransferase Ste14 [Cereibacter changlensis]
MKNFDYPPVWTLLCIALGLMLDRLWPLDLFGAVGRYLGAAAILAGLGLMLLAVERMRRAATTVMPHRAPSALVTDGVFRWSRNPIYLGDLLVLLGVLLWADAPLGLLALPLLMVVLTRRFILPEEARLAEGFGPAFSQWSKTTRRWL